jgi:hypothetical protein
VAEGVFTRINEELSGLEFSPPYIRFCVKGLCHVLIVVGDKDDGFKGCLESLLLQRLKINEETSRLVDNFVSYRERRLSRLSRCERAKLRFYLTVLALSNDVGALYMDKNFVEELFDLEGEDFVRGVLSDFIEIKRESG